MIGSPAGLLAVREARQVVPGSLVWDRTAWAVVVDTRPCGGSGPSHPWPGDPCAVLVLRQAVDVVRGAGTAAEVHFRPLSPLVVATPEGVTSGAAAG